MYISDPTVTNLGLGLATMLTAAIMVIRELNPVTRMKYSKFAISEKTSLKIPSRIGMLLIYSPAAAISLWAMVSTLNKHAFWISQLNFLHYLKRLYEVLSIHRYSGHTSVIDACMISTAYASLTGILVFLATQVPLDMISQRQMILGLCFFLAGEILNHYHHRVLANLRKSKGDTTYKIPEGGLFELVWCPHYLGEIVTFMALVLVSQNILALPLQIAATAYLGCRAFNTKKWYESRFPAATPRKALIPGLF
ncbi:3-oxo-5-alpha-steroid 4-dehydrogenase-domain-containing protein [Fennellomyces sp. T-0311]|nr:3-oxo-5-alpha-steroid 4-dehydrogenase-domain-containing protein [Fennellomyces sp. T-0311]